MARLANNARASNNPANIAAVVAHAAVSAIQRASHRSKTQADNSNKVES